MVDVSAAANTLADAIVAALPGWVERSVDRVYRAAVGPPPPDVMEAARRAGADAAADIEPRLRALLDTDIDEQRSTPLAVVRGAVRYPTEVLRAYKVAPGSRHEHDQAMFPNDLYGLTPANFADLDPGVADPGFTWGAAKALAHRARHQ